MTIEQRLVRDYGVTDDPALAVWLLRDGTLVNGSHEGHQRDVDHREINAYFKPSVRARPAEGDLYIAKFERRGNVRWHLNEFGMCLELVGPPSAAQLRVIANGARLCRQMRAPTRIVRRASTNPRRDSESTFLEYIQYLRRYTTLLNEAGIDPYLEI